jgi:transcriptional regulator with XRE-family HTH domain
MGERLREAREMAGLKQRELDRLASLCGGHVWQIESGRRDRNPTLSTLDRLATALGLRLDWLVHGKGPPPKPDEVARAALKAAAAKR